MAFQEIRSLDTDTVITLGGVDKKTKKTNPKQVEGYYLGKRALPPGKYTKPGKTDYMYIFQTPEGNVGVWGKPDLDRKLASTAPGNMLRVTYAGMKPTPKGDMHTYKVEVDSENTIDVSDLATPGASQADSYSDDSEVEEDDDQEDGEIDSDDTPAPRGVNAQAVAERAARVANLLSKNKQAKN